MIQLVENAKNAWRWFSVQAMTLAIALQGTWALLDPDMRAQVPKGVVAGITIILLVAGIAGRLVAQPNVGKPAAPPETPPAPPAP